MPPTVSTMLLSLCVAAIILFVAPQSILIPDTPEITPGELLINPDLTGQGPDNLNKIEPTPYRQPEAPITLPIGTTIPLQPDPLPPLQLPDLPPLSPITTPSPTPRPTSIPSTWDPPPPPPLLSPLPPPPPLPEGGPASSTFALPPPPPVAGPYTPERIAELERQFFAANAARKNNGTHRVGHNKHMRSWWNPLDAVKNKVKQVYNDAMEKIKQFLNENVLHKVKGSKPPPQEEGFWGTGRFNIHRMHILDFKWPSMKYDIEPPHNISFTINGGNLEVDGGWTVYYHKIYTILNNTGDFVAGTGDVSLIVLGQIVKENGGKPKFINEACDVHFGAQLGLKITGGGNFGKFINYFTDMLNRVAKFMLNRVLCVVLKYLVKFGINILPEFLFPVLFKGLEMDAPIANHAGPGGGQHGHKPQHNKHHG